MKNQKDNRLKNIIKIREDVYEIQISNGTRDDGKRDRITETVYGNEEYAIARRDKLIEEIAEKKQKGLKASNSGYTFLEVAKMFLEDRDYSKKVGTTITGYKMYLNNYILPVLADKKIRNITEEDLQKLYKKMSETKSRTGKNLTGTTIKHTHTLIGTIFNYAIFKKWSLYNPAMFVINAPTFDTKEREYYDHEEIEHALSCLDKISEHKNGMSDKILHSQNLRFKTAIILLFNGGFRRGELFGLKWKDINYKTGVFSIKRSVTSADSKEFDPRDIVENLHNGIVCKHLKNDSSRRDVCMPTVCLEILNEYKNDQLNCGFPAGPEDFIFQNVRYPGIWNPNNLTKEWSVFKKIFNLKDITIHDIRHSHATDLLAMGVPIQDVSRRLGHSDVSTTLRIYTHSNLGQDKLIVEKLENKYENKFLTSKLSVEVIMSFITGLDFCNEKDLFNAITYLTGKQVCYENFRELKEKCKEYLINQSKYFKYLDKFISDEMDIISREEFFYILLNLNKDVSEIRPMYM